MSIAGAGRNQPYATISGLQMGMEYWFRVCAHNSVGDSQWAVLPGPVNIGGVDLDIDSDNDGIVGNGNEENIEDDTDKPGKIIAANDSYWSGYDLNESIPFDFDDAGETSGFVPLRLTLPAWLDLSRAKIRFLYDACPLGDEADGLLRIWRSNSSVRGADDVINADTQYLARELGMAKGAREVTLWVEGVKWSESLGDGRIEVVVDPTGQGGSEGVDGVRGTVVGVDLSIDANGDEVITSADDVSGPVVIEVNNDDTDGDGVPGFAEGARGSESGTEEAGQPNMPSTLVLMKVSPVIDLSVARFRFVYAGSSPTDDMSLPSLTTHTGYVINSGRLRLWSNNGAVQYVVPGQAMAASQLGLNGNGVALYFLEAVGESSVEGEFVSIELDVLGTGKWVRADSIRVRSLDDPARCALQPIYDPANPRKMILAFTPSANVAAVRIERLGPSGVWQTMQTMATVSGVTRLTVSGLDDKYVHSFRAVTINAVGETTGLPVRTLAWTNKDPAMRTAFYGFRAAEMAHQPFLYYEPAGVRVLFDKLSLAMTTEHVSFKIKPSLALPTSPAKAVYDPRLDTLSIAPSPDPSDVVHEMIHALDDQNDWYIDAWGSYNQAEALAYGAEYLLAAARQSVGSLSAMESKTFSTDPAAQQYWNATWNAIQSSSIGMNIQWTDLTPPLTHTRPLTAADVSDVGAKLGLVLSTSALLPIYNQILVSRGHAPRPLNNNFSFTLALPFN